MVTGGCSALRTAPDGLPGVSTYAIWVVLHEAGADLAAEPRGARREQVKRRRKSGVVIRRSRCGGEKNLLSAYRESASQGLEVWCHDQAGPYPTRPIQDRLGSRRGCTAASGVRACGDGKLLTLFHPQDGHLRAKGATQCPNAESCIRGCGKLSAVSTTRAARARELSQSPATNDRQLWGRWQEEPDGPFTLPEILPALRVLLIWTI